VSNEGEHILFQQGGDSGLSHLGALGRSFGQPDPRHGLKGIGCCICLFLLSTKR
jgi:hypothetical protein